MSSFAPGTPQSTIDAVNARLYGTPRPTSGTIDPGGAATSRLAPMNWGNRQVGRPNPIGRLQEWMRLRRPNNNMVRPQPPTNQTAQLDRVQDWMRTMNPAIYNGAGSTPPPTNPTVQQPNTGMGIASQAPNVAKSYEETLMEMLAQMGVQEGPTKSPNNYSTVDVNGQPAPALSQPSAVSSILQLLQDYRIKNGTQPLMGG